MIVMYFISLDQTGIFVVCLVVGFEACNDNWHIIAHNST